jgi:hypothetical protein
MGILSTLPHLQKATSLLGMNECGRRREQRQLCGQDCDPLDEIMISSSVSKVNPSHPADAVHRDCSAAKTPAKDWWLGTFLSDLVCGELKRRSKPALLLANLFRDPRSRLADILVLSLLLEVGCCLH